MARSTTKDAQALLHSLRSAYAATPTNLKIIDLYIVFAVVTALLQVVYMVVVGSFPFNSFLSGYFHVWGLLSWPFVFEFKSTKKTRNSRICLQNVLLQILYYATWCFIWLS